MELTTKQYRCKSCGNKTRFHVIRTLRIWTYEHLGLSGDLLGVEEEKVLREYIESVDCYACGPGGVVVERDEEGNDKTLVLGIQTRE